MSDIESGGQNQEREAFSERVEVPKEVRAAVPVAQQILDKRYPDDRFVLSCYQAKSVDGGVKLGYTSSNIGNASEKWILVNSSDIGEPNYARVANIESQIDILGDPTKAMTAVGHYPIEDGVVQFQTKRKGLFSRK